MSAKRWAVVGLWLAGAGLATVPARASLIWSANFDSYSAGDNVTINTTGDDNTFRQLTSAGGFVGTPQAAVIAQPAGFTTSEAMALGPRRLRPAATCCCANTRWVAMARGRFWC
ncbi:MAG: hypothetical protein K9N49_01785 [Candidatus Marinimicrobia bacterium]|nr:hypothetical protein [Candidatus Neomarinimicrobiota bacterium]